MQSSKWLMRIFLLFALAVTAWASFVSWGQLERHKRITEEVNQLETEAARIQAENQTLEERMSYFSTREFREQEAREKLGLKKADETVVAIKEDIRRDSVPNDVNSQNASETEETPIPNYRKWWQIFFH
jgi:cell division protein FtsB